MLKSAATHSRARKDRRIWPALLAVAAAFLLAALGLVFLLGFIAKALGTNVTPAILIVLGILGFAGLVINAVGGLIAALLK